ncbi:MAG: Hsp33 family molecular chaperone HslO [Planctomycetes bacterium]|nr:Hsp33 family molecular chaperone HslO [Planctomycetota bacterium]
MDTLTRGFSKSTNLRFDLVNVTNTARILEGRHLAGPSAAQVMGQGLAGAALLSADLDREDERVSIQMKVDGPVGGMMAEASRNGDLRAYTYIKVMNDIDGFDITDLAPVLGQHGSMGVVRSTSEKTLYAGQVQASPPDIRTGLARYYNESLQVPTAVSIYTSTKDGYINRAIGLAAEKMPDGDTEAFVRVLERFDDNSVQQLLATADRLAAFKDLFELEDLKVVELRDLRFGCTCNEKKIIEAVSSLSIDELREMVATGESQQVTCHFCGETYTIKPDGIRTILEEKLDRD